jgi:FkbM family methyltransferase
LRFARLIIRRFAKLAVSVMPESARRRVRTVPFSRFAPLIPVLFSGRESVSWRGITLVVDPGEVFGYWFYFCGEYEPDPELDWLVRHAAGARTFADVGAHIGMYTIALAASHPSLLVTAFEASPVNAGRLRGNIRLNRSAGSRISVAEVALSDSSGMSDFIEARGRNSGVGYLVKGGTSNPESIRVPTTTLSEYFAGRIPPDLVKIDVEGAELDVLQGWGDLPPAQAILIELHAPTQPDEVDRRPRVVQWLVERGYKIEFRVDQGIVAACPDPMPGRLHALATRPS